MNNPNRPKVFCVVGPTSAGKSELAVELAKKYNGEIISADSRQIYYGLDLASGKVEGKWKTIPFTRNPERAKQVDGSLQKDPGSSTYSELKASSEITKEEKLKRIYTYKDIAHHLIDEVNPKKQFSVSEFKAKAKDLISKIHKRGRLPILCGGTMHWIDAVAFDQTFPQVSPNPELRKELSELTNEELFDRLNKIDPDRAATIDSQNPRRLIRAIEIVETTGQPVPEQNTEPPYDLIWIGINPGMEVIEDKIKIRLEQRLKDGMIEEIEKLLKEGVTHQRLEDLGLECRYISLFLRGHITREQLIEQLATAIRQYAKRQLTWWKRNADIQWFKTQSEALKNLAN
ncbi:MAG: tRNA (adenosine(37)-N6)-dimethylallyltransferase MiaA [Candidatus Doudnabacteria bacterium]